MNRLYFLLVFAVIPLLSPAQTGGLSAFSFLKLPPSSRLTALGGSLIAVRDDDPALAVLNPAALNGYMHQGMTFQHNFHFDGIYNGYAGYAHQLQGKDITLHGGIQFMQYGEFDLADEFGNLQGTFDASDLALTLGAAKKISDQFSAGVNMRFVSSNLESYSSSALLFDIGGSYWNAERQFGAGLVLRNVGAQLSTYAGESEDVPIDLQIGIAKRLQHLPFRFSVTAHSLNQWNLRFDNLFAEEPTTIIGEESNQTSQFSKELDNFFRHMIFGGEFLLGKNDDLQVRVGYNHQRRKELTVSSLRSFAGFSAGFGLRIKQFVLDYGFGVYHIAGSTQHIGIATNLSRFKKGSILD